MQGKAESAVRVGLCVVNTRVAGLKNRLVVETSYNVLLRNHGAGRNIIPNISEKTRLGIEVCEEGVFLG